MTAVADLKIVRILDPRKLSKEAIEYFDKYEKGARVVDADRARDHVWTEEVVEATVDFGIADADGEILASGFADVRAAEKARAGAKVSFKLEVAPEATEDSDEDLD